MRGIRAARKLFSLSGREWRDLANAQLAIINATWQLRAIKIGDLVRGAPPVLADATAPRSASDLHGQGQQALTATEDLAAEERAEQLALALARAAEHGPLRPLCLVRSIALRRLLESNGVKGGEIRVGVLRRGDDLLAHAWVEFNGSVIGDRAEYVARFSRISALRISELV